MSKSILLLLTVSLCFACQRPSPCETEALLSGEGLRFYPLSPAQVQAWIAADTSPSDELDLVRDSAKFHRWARQEAPDLVGQVDFSSEMLTLSGMANETCTECVPIRVDFDATRAWVQIKLSPVSDDRCLVGLEEAAFRPNGLLVFRSPNFEVEQVETSLTHRR